eukprot:2070257-Rhodomonas_salina.1
MPSWYTALWLLLSQNGVLVCSCGTESGGDCSTNGVLSRGARYQGDPGTGGEGRCAGAHCGGADGEDRPQLQG